MKIYPLTAAVCVACSLASVLPAFVAAQPVSSDSDLSAVFGSAKLSSTQVAGGSVSLAPSLVKSTSFDASIGAGAMDSVSGNVGVNVAAGALNVQANQIAVIDTPVADISSTQTVSAIVQLSGGGRASLGADALVGVSGNVGMNLTAGVGNAQYNGFIVH